jgi:hypothetical protein
MPLKLTAPIYENYYLERSDELYKNEDEPTTVTIKQAAQGEHEQRQSLFSRLEQKWNQLSPEEVSLVQTISMEEVKKLEVYLTLVDCNILDYDDNPLFPSKKDKEGNLSLSMSKAKFASAWAKLLPETAKEIHEKVLELNPLWRREAGEDM